jgi:hypothetical protein
MADGYGNEFHPSPLLLEGRDEWGVFLGLLLVFFVATKVPREPNLNENEDTCTFVETSPSRVGRIRDPSCVYEVRRCAMASFEEGFIYLFW